MNRDVAMFVVVVGVWALLSTSTLWMPAIGLAR